jgi:putative Holliday junction resolvase
MGVDFGFKRIGIAFAEADPHVVTPRPSIAASGTLKKDAQTLAAMARKELADRIVIGLPVEESGEEGRMARICRTLAGHIEDAGIMVSLVDESLTSVLAEANLRSEQNRRASEIRKLKDGEAARLILERFLHERKED